MSRATARERHLVLYDGDCPLCVFQQRLLTWLDWRDRVDFLPVSEVRSRGLCSGISREDLLEAMETGRAPLSNGIHFHYVPGHSHLLNRPILLSLSVTLSLDLADHKVTENALQDSH